MHILSPASRYLCLDIDNDAPCRKLLVRDGDTLVYDLDVFLATDPACAQCRMYVDMAPFFGKSLTFTLACDGGEEPYTPTCIDVRPDATDYSSPLRPLSHFTTRYGWINDPNGLVYADGVYHMFYQHNPAGTRWGNMHWGHATSPDLVHWTEQDEALYPDTTGTMYSGSAVADMDNLSGLGDGTHTPILLYYTAAGENSLLSHGQPFTQRLAYSTDGGVTFHKYPDGMIPHIIGGNRDPKVVWAEELSCWLLALYLDGNEYALFRSPDLLHWSEFQRLTLPMDAECPDFYPLTCIETNERLWVYSGASDTYIVGRLTEGGFVPIQENLRYQLGGADSYAAQTFFGTDRRIKIAWGRTGGDVFCGQMLFPTEVVLHKDPDGTYRLATNPVDEIETLYTDTAEPAAFDISLTIPAHAAPITGDILGLPITIDPVENRIVLPGGRVIPLAYTAKEVYDVRMLVDTISLEVFADGGRIYTVQAVRLARTMRPDMPDTVRLPGATVHRLAPIWN